MIKNIFVYGTLKKGYWNNPVLGDSELIGQIAISGFKLYESGIPYMIPSSDPEDAVYGELYRVTDDRVLRGLDRLEGHPTFYERTEIESGDAEYGTIETYIYQSVPHCPESPKVNGVYLYKGGEKPR